MLSPLTEAMIVNGVVLATVLATDLGPARKIGPLRLLRPVIAAAVIVPLFVSRPVTHGAGLAVELAGIVAGLLGGLAAAALMGVYRSPENGRPVSRAGLALACTMVGRSAGQLVTPEAMRHPGSHASPRKPGVIPEAAFCWPPGCPGERSLISLRADRRPPPAPAHTGRSRCRPRGRWAP